MSFSPKNVSQMMVLLTPMADIAAYTAASAVGDYLLTKELNAVPALAGTNYAETKAIQLMVRTANGDKTVSMKASGFDSYKASTLVIGSEKIVSLAVLAGIAGETTKVTAVINDGIGSMLNERFISAYVTLDAAGKFLNAAGTLVDGTTLANLIDELVAQLNSSFVTAGTEIVATNVTDTALVLTGQATPFKVGVNDGHPLPFDVIAGTIGAAGESLSAIAQTVTASKIDDLIALKNLEWFISGYSKDPYRVADAISSFSADSDLIACGIAIGDLVGIYQYHEDREGTNVERQPRQLILVAEAGQVDHSTINTAFNTLLVKA